MSVTPLHTQMSTFRAAHEPGHQTGNASTRLCGRGLDDGQMLPDSATVVDIPCSRRTGVSSERADQANHA